MLQVMPNDKTIETGNYYDIEFGAVDVADGVQLIFKVNGKTIFDYTDNDTYITDQGYLSFVATAVGCPIEIQVAQAKMEN